MCSVCLLSFQVHVHSRVHVYFYKHNSSNACTQQNARVVRCVYVSILLYIYVYSINGSIFTADTFTADTFTCAHPHLNVVSGGLWQLLVEPRRRVEGAAAVQRTTTSTIPQRVIRVEPSYLKASCTGSVTKVVISNKCWRGSGSTGLIGSSAGTVTLREGANFIKCCSKGPDVLSWVSMRETNAVHIVAVDIVWCQKAVSRSNLIGSNLATHFGITYCGNWNCY